MRIDTVTDRICISSRKCFQIKEKQIPSAEKERLVKMKKRALVMMSTAMRACPVASCETQRLQPMPAGGTRLRRREEGADLHKDLALLLRLVFALAHELAPSHVGNSPCKMVVLHHVFDS